MRGVSRIGEKLVGVRVVIEGHHLPGRRCGDAEAGLSYDDVHVGLRVKNDVVDITPGDADAGRWEADVRVVVADDGELDFRWPAVQGKRGDRHLALRWLAGHTAEDEVFRGAKLKLEAIDPSIVRAADQPGAHLRARIHLTDECEMPRCATVKAPHLV
jgi:Family of unknown function (DUF5990)